MTNKVMKFIVSLVLIVFFTQESSAIWCYSCTSATPGCSDNFNWRGIGYLGVQCPEDNDFCVKIIERKHATEVITRDCYSALRGIRKDLPADQYEGCRPASKYLMLGHYVNHSIPENDVHRKYYDSTTFCYCFLDHRCNGSTSLHVKWGFLPLLGILLFKFIW